MNKVSGAAIHCKKILKQKSISILCVSPRQVSTIVSNVKNYHIKGEKVDLWN